jgi:hypothetical protein
MSFRSHKPKSFKEKLQDLKDLASGKKTLDSLVEANKPGKSYFVDCCREDGLFEVQEGSNPEKVLMTKEQYELWRESRSQTSPMDFVILCQNVEGTGPTIETTENLSGVIWKEKKTYSDHQVTSRHITEFRDYSGKDRSIEVQVVKPIEAGEKPANEP